MRRNATAQEDHGSKTPAWLVSFTDMITLLLAFFVMLQALAQAQDPELYHQGRGAFRRAVVGLGIPDLLFGKQRKIVGPDQKRRYATEDDEDGVEGRVIDPGDQEIRQVFAELKKTLETRTSNAAPKLIGTFITPIRFEPSGVSLDEPARRYLAQLAGNLEQSVHRDAVKIRVVGLAPDQPAGKGRWILSARRAAVVEDFLRDALSEAVASRSWTLQSWGAGTRQSGAVKRASYIQITVLEVE